MKEYLSYPDGYNKLVRKVLPIYFWPAKKMLMPLFLQILKDG